MPFLLSPQVTPQGGAGTLPLSQASSSLSTTGQGEQKMVGGRGGENSAGFSPNVSSGSGYPWASRLSQGVQGWGWEEAQGKGPPHPSWPEPLAFIFSTISHEKSVEVPKGDNGLRLCT